MYKHTKVEGEEPRVEFGASETDFGGEQGRVKD